MAGDLTASAGFARNPPAGALVTGATGFVGGALCQRLSELGVTLHALVRAGSPRQELESTRAVLHEGDLADPNTIADAAEGCELLFHCASESALHAPPAALSWINVAGTENAIAAARHAGVRRVVLLSCADVSLLNRDRLHWKEAAVLGQEPLGALARSKLLAEELALQASDARLCVTALRPAFLWGPAERHNLPALCAEGLGGGVRLFGSGDALFATTHVDNLVEALLAAARAPEAGGRAFHVADGEVLTAREFFAKLSEALGLPRPRRGLYAFAYAAAWLRRGLQREGAWPEDVARRGRACLLDCLQAVQSFDYQPRVSIEQGMAELARWGQAAGGAAAIARLARPPAGHEEIARHQRLAGHEPH